MQTRDPRNWRLSRFRSPVLERVVAATSDRLGVRRGLIESRKRTKGVAFARMLAMYIARKKTNLSFTELGTFFHREHTTILYAVREIEAAMDAELEAVIGSIEAAMVKMQLDQIGERRAKSVG